MIVPSAAAARDLGDLTCPNIDSRLLHRILCAGEGGSGLHDSGPGAGGLDLACRPQCDPLVADRVVMDDVSSGAVAGQAPSERSSSHLREALAVIAACRHLSPAEQHGVAIETIAGSEPVLLTLALAHLALAGFEQYARRESVTVDALLEQLGIECACLVGPPSRAERHPTRR
jgi:hypothetical protein